MGDIAKGRELLRRVFRNGEITLLPKAGFYVAKSEVLPLMLLTMRPETKSPPRQGHDGDRFLPVSCAGAIEELDHVFSEPLVFAMVA